jgi:hypothetical protein
MYIITSHTEFPAPIRAYANPPQGCGQAQVQVQISDHMSVFLTPSETTDLIEVLTAALTSRPALTQVYPALASA